MKRVDPTEQQLAYYRRYRTKHGDVLRMIRMQAAPAEPEPDERITPWRLLGLVIFGLAMWATLLYAVPIVLIGLSGGAS